MENILVATDLSERSDRAMHRAFQLAERHDATLTVLNVVDSAFPDDLANKIKENTEERLERYCKSISRHPCTLLVRIADPALCIHAEAEAANADLIVLGLHRRRPVVDLFKSTTLVRLVAASRRPVLVVRDPVDHDYRRPVCGLDLSPSSAAAARMAAALCPDAPIATFHAVHVPFRSYLAPEGSAEDLRPFIDEAARRIDEWLPASGLPAQCEKPEIVAESAPLALRRTIEATKADLIALGAHGRASLAPTHLGSFVEELLYEPPCDVLVVRA